MSKTASPEMGDNVGANLRDVTGMNPRRRCSYNQLLLLFRWRCFHLHSVKTAVVPDVRLLATSLTGLDLAIASS
jgi:hypothetical protein